MTQLTLFDTSPSQRPAAGPARGLPVHATDPDPSRRAAHRHAQRAQSNKRRIVELLQLYKGVSSWELSEICELDRHEIARRLPELEREGRVERRIDPATGKYREGENGVAWWPR